jgi:hypothetical protein
MRSNRLTSATDVWAVRCIFFEMATGELSFGGHATACALLAAIAEVVEDPSTGILTSMKVSLLDSFLARQSKRWLAVRSRLTIRLPVACQQLDALFEAVFPWDPAEQHLISAISQHSVFLGARQFH